MKRTTGFIRAAGISATLLLEGSSSPLTEIEFQVTAPDTSSLVFERRVEREVSKYHQSVVALLQSDVAVTDSRIQFRKVDQTTLDLYRRDGSLDFAAYFDLDRGSLNVIDSIDPELNDQSIDAIDHEIGHVIYAQLYGKPVPESDCGGFRFSGPKREAVTEYCMRRVWGPEFREIRASIDLQIEVQSYFELLNKFYSEQSRTSNIVKKFLKSDYSEEIQAHKDFLDHQSLEELCRNTSQLRLRYGEYQNLSGPIFHELNRMLGSMTEALRNGTVCKEDVDRCKSYLTESTQALSPYRDLADRALRLKADTRSLFHDAQTRSDQFDEDKSKLRIDRLTTELSTVSDPVRREQIEQSIKRAQEDLALLKEMHQIGLWDFDLELITLELTNDRRAEIVCVMNRSNLNKILGDPNEVFARMVDSLMNVYFGPTQQNQFPLTDADLDFLLQFKANSEPIFGQAVEKYRFATRMIGAGLSPEEVRRLLEYASDASFRGEGHKWLATPFIIKGNIPGARR